MLEHKDEEIWAQNIVQGQSVCQDAWGPRQCLASQKKKDKKKKNPESGAKKTKSWKPE